jgi:hypothetical protein
MKGFHKEVVSIQEGIEMRYLSQTKSARLTSEVAQQVFLKLV